MHNIMELPIANFICFILFVALLNIQQTNSAQTGGSCDFDEKSRRSGNNLCGYTHGSSESEEFFDWQMEIGGNGHYMNVKTEEHTPGQKARLYSEAISQNDTHCVTFQYHMEGGKSGNATGSSNSLNVYIVDISHSPLLLPVWQSTPVGYGSGWTTVQLALSKWAYKIVFEAEVKDASPGVIALDKITVDDVACKNAPHFLRVTEKNVNEGQDVSLDCMLRGPNLVFSDDNSNVNSTKVVLQRANGDELEPFAHENFDEYIRVNFRFPKILRNQADDYRCISKTAVSVGVSNYAKLTIKIPPVPQGPPAVKTSGSTHLKIYLNAEKYVGDGPIIRTILNYRPVNGSWSDVHEIKDKDYHLWHLLPDTKYEMSVTLVRPGIGGTGKPGSPLVTQTNCGIPLSSVKKIEPQPIATSQIKIMWQEPDFSITRCRYYEYRIKYRKYSVDNSLEYESKTVKQNNNFAMITELSTYTMYQFKVELINSEGSFESGNYTASTGEGVPGPIPKDSFFVVKANETSISVQWDKPVPVNGELICYEIALRGLSSFQPDFTPQQDSTTIQFKASELNGTLNPLHPGTNYTLSIRARTNAGFSLTPIEITASTTIAAPKMPVYPPPTPDNGTFSTDTTIEVEIKPAEANGAPISNYYIVIEEIPSGSPSEKVSRSRSGSKANKKRKKNRKRQKRQIVIDTGSGNGICHSDPITFEESKKQNKTFYFGGKLSPDSVKEGTKFTVGQGSDSGGFTNPPLDPNKRYNIYIRVDSNIGNDTRINCSLVAIKASVPPTTPELPPTTIKTTTLATTVSTTDITSSGIVIHYEPPENPAKSDKLVKYGSIGGAIFFFLIILIVIVVIVFLRRKRKSNPKDEVVNPFEVRMMMSDIPATANGHSLARSGASGDRQALMMPDVVEDYLEKTFDPTGTRMGTYRSDSSPLAEDRPALRVDDFHIHVNEMKRLNNSGFHEEFTSFREGQIAPWDFGKKEENRGKNRYGNIMAYDHSRVLLQPIKGEEDQIQSDYINANYVIGYKNPSMYIAAQAPLPDTVNDFWKMIWQEKCPVIVMVTNLVELGKRKCDKYWPEERGQYGTINVSLTDSEELCDYCIRTFVIQHADGYHDAREIKQFHFTTWPDHGVPDRPTNILSFVRRIKSYEPPGPTIVHCSAGSGRTGCYIVIDMMLDMARDEGVIDIYNTVTELRSRRVNMVQTEEQYIFIHDAILEALLCGDTLVGANQLRQHYDDLITVDQQTQIAPVQEEFETLNVMTPKLTEEECSVARLPRNSTKNRFMDVLPADRQFSHLMTPHPNEPDSNYINAVFADSYVKRNAFIVTQMPMPTTVIDIWRLIYDYNCTSIIMMNDATEHDKTCAQYWPDSGSIVFGPFSVELVKKEDEVDVISRLFKLQYINRPSEGFRLVQQFQLTNWPATQPVPYTRNAVLRVIQLVTKWQSECTDNDGRMLVHCVAGAGRSGTFVACYNMCLQLQHEYAVDVFNIVQLLRNIRPQLVETLEQYRFCYEVGWDFADQLQ